MRTPEERLRDRIRRRQAMPFTDFMEEALYGTDGYYDRDRPAIGPAGDFVTGSTLSPLFGQTTARLVEALDDDLGAPADYLEAGCGGGEHIATVAAELAKRRDASVRKLLAWDRVPRPVSAGVTAVDELSEIAENEVQGVVFSYELLDALPVHRLVHRQGELRELWVVERDGEFCWEERELTEPELGQRYGSSLEEGQIVDATLEWGTLYGALCRRLGRGLIVTCDYGFTRDRLLDVRVRRHGTLACFRRHRVHRNPLVDVGRQDLTAHVDFSMLIEAGEAEGLKTVGLFRQAEWLAALGLLDGMENRTPEERIEVMELMNLEGMGEEIRVLVQSRGLDAVEAVPGLREIVS